MNTSKWIKGLIVVFLCLVVSPLAYGDIYWESEQVTKGIEGQQDETTLVKTYFMANAIRTETGDLITIMDLDAMMMYQLDPTTKTYTQMKMDQIAMPGMDEKQAQAVQEMMKEMMKNVKITPTNETQKIAGYMCKKYTLTVMTTTTDYWLSKEVKEYAEMKAISSKMIEAFARNPMLKQMNIMGMIDQLDGFPVQTVIQMMGGAITNTLKRIEKTTVDQSLFKVPVGYTLQKTQ
jgi:hypothetical protein